METELTIARTLQGQCDTERAADSAVVLTHTSPEWSGKVHLSSGEEVSFTKKDLIPALRSGILADALQPNDKIDLNSLDEKGNNVIKTMSLLDFTKSDFSLRILFQPVWSYAMAGLKWGAIIGAGLKLIETTISLGMVNPGLAVLFVIAIGACFIPRIGFVAVIILSILMTKFTGANLFLMGLTSALTGAILGCLPGMFVGGLIGRIKKDPMNCARDLSAEPTSVVLKAIVLPFAGAVALILFYVLVFNQWLIQVLSS